MKFLAEVLAQHTIKKPKDLPVMLKTIRQLVKSLKATVVLGGSIARGTHLDVYDCDIFVLFPPTVENISDRLAMALKSLQPERVHGSRDYFHIHKDGTLYEIIPVRKVKNPTEAENVTDMSPLHLVWVKKHINGLENDVRLFKLFLKAHKLYGAESYIQGLSGHVTEILVIYYKGFLPCLRAIAKWKSKTVIDSAHHYPSKQDIEFSLNKAKQLSPLVLVDPVQPDRNAAAALSVEQYKSLIAMTKLFLKKPTPLAFEEPGIDLDFVYQQARKEKATVLVFSIVPVRGKRDVVGSKLVKIFDHICTQLEFHGFNVLDKDWNWETMYCMVKPVQLSVTKKQYGPSTSDRPEHIKNFQKKHKVFKLEHARYYAVVTRQYRTPEDLADALVHDVYITERVLSIQCQKKEIKN